MRNHEKFVTQGKYPLSDLRIDVKAKIPVSVGYVFSQVSYGNIK